MMPTNVLKKYFIYNLRKYSTKIKPQVEVNEEVVKNIENGVIKPRKHPGIFRPKTINVPEQFVIAAEKSLKDYPAAQILSSSKALANYIYSRHPPIENTEFREKKNRIYQHLQAKYIDPENPPANEDAEIVESKIKKEVIKKLKQKVYHWQPIEYDVYKSLEYLLSRSAAEYAVLSRIFHEISYRDPEFKPRSFFDFGSGTGTGIWAAQAFWKKSIFEYFNVDISSDMNDLAMILLKGGTGLGDSYLKGVFFRQFFPATNTSYDLVLSSYSLFELPSSKVRLETIMNLWNKTEKYLVLTEVGTNAGFQLINEARDFILNIEDERNRGHVFAPCPHEEPCPRMVTDLTPCNFDIQYMTMPIGQISELRREQFSYIILKKGKPTENLERWPRIVRPTLIRSKHAICRMCTANGKLEEIIFTSAKQGQVAHRCAKACEVGDLLPIKISLPKI